MRLTRGDGMMLVSQSKAIAITQKPSAIAPPGPITRRPQVQHGLDANGSTLHCGKESVPLSTVVAYRCSDLSEKDLSTAFATIAVFSAVAAIMVFGVLEIGWRTRFLFEGALFGAIALCAGGELFSSRRQTLFTFALQLVDGRQVTFATVDPGEARHVKAALDAVCVASR